MVNFFNLSYLAAGSAIQKKGLAAIQHLRVMEILRDHDPVLAGTLPLDLFVDGSDLDVLCFANDLIAFEKKTRVNFGGFPCFNVRSKTMGSIPSVMARFLFEDFWFEIFAQPVPTREQIAYRHLIHEHAILEERGEEFRERVIELKKSGIKTEPAFAQLLQLDGNPYQAILGYPV